MQRGTLRHSRGIAARRRVRTIAKVTLRCLGAAVLALAGLVSESGPVRGAGCTSAPDPATTVAAPARQLLSGFRRYNGTCNHCHGPDGVGGSFAGSLIEAPLPWPAFCATVMEGTTQDSAAGSNTVMRGFGDDPNVAPFIADIYAYLTARSTGAVGRGRPKLPE